MLLLCIFLMSWCLPGSTGSATKEFERNLKALLALTNKETFIGVPSGKFQCNLVPCQLESTIERLKVSIKTDQMRTRRILISKLEKNKNHIISALNKGPTQPKEKRTCLMRDLDQRNVLRHFEDYFEKLHENCLHSW